MTKKIKNKKLKSMTSGNLRLWYHPESDCYFLETMETQLSLKNDFDSAYCEDVTGIKSHEKEAASRGIPVYKIKDQING
jgi:hypothetical protein